MLYFKIDIYRKMDLKSARCQISAFNSHRSDIYGKTSSFFLVMGIRGHTQKSSIWLCNFCFSNFPMQNHCFISTKCFYTLFQDSYLQENGFKIWEMSNICLQVSPARYLLSNKFVFVVIEMEDEAQKRNEKQNLHVLNAKNPTTWFSLV